MSASRFYSRIHSCAYCHKVPPRRSFDHLRLNKPCYMGNDSAVSTGLSSLISKYKRTLSKNPETVTSHYPYSIIDLVELAVYPSSWKDSSRVATNWIAQIWKSQISCCLVWILFIINCLLLGDRLSCGTNPYEFEKYHEFLSH